MKLASITLVVLAAVALPATALAEDTYPNRPVTMVVPFPPGGGTDTGARLIAQKLGERWKQSVIVDNKPGASGMIGADLAARAKPDGYTLVMVNMQVAAVNPALFKKINYSSDSFAPITLVAELPLVLLVNADLPASTPKELVALALAKPGKLSYSSAGYGSSTQLAASLFEIATGTKLLHVPYKGGGPAMQDLMAGQVNLTFLTVLESNSAIKSGKVRPVAVTSKARSPAMPNVPTLGESGLPGFDSISWIGLEAPAGTPKAIVDKIAKDVQEIVSAPEMRERLIAQGATPVGGTPAQFKALIDTDTQRYRKLIVEKNISATD